MWRFFATWSETLSIASGWPWQWCFQGTVWDNLIRIYKQWINGQLSCLESYPWTQSIRSVLCCFFILVFVEWQLCVLHSQHLMSAARYNYPVKSQLDIILPLHTDDQKCFHCESFCITLTLSDTFPCSNIWYLALKPGMEFSGVISLGKKPLSTS